MKRWIYSIIVTITILIGGFIFIKNKFSESSYDKRDFIVIKTTGNSLYPFELTFPKGTSAGKIAKSFFNDPTNLQIKKGKTWKDVYVTDKIYKDSILKKKIK